MFKVEIISGKESMSDFEKLKQLLVYIFLFVVIAPFVVLSEPMWAICISTIIIFPFLAMWFVDYRKFKKSNFKRYEQYWYYHHNMKN